MIKDFEPEIAAITLIPSDGGCFEVTINDRLIFSKLTLDRYPEPGEVAGEVKKILKGVRK